MTELDFEDRTMVKIVHLENTGEDVKKLLECKDKVSRAGYVFESHEVIEALNSSGLACPGGRGAVLTAEGVTLQNVSPISPSLKISSEI